MQHLVPCLCRYLTMRHVLIRQNSSYKGKSPLRRLLDEASSFGEVESELTDPELRWATQPYVTRPSEAQNVAERVNPQETTVLLFPGEGSQRAGMGRQLLEIPAAKELYEFASSIVGWDVRRECERGATSRRAPTAVLVTALAALERAREERPGAVQRARAAAGLGVGELGALVLGGALPLERALRLQELRAAAEHAAAQERAGAALTVWLAPDAELGEAMARACAAAGRAAVCAVSAHLYAGCKVVAGDEAALRWLEREGARWGVRRAQRLAAGAAHSPLMASAEAVLREALREEELRTPRLAVWCCAEARPYGDARHVRRGLARHATRAQRWEQTLHALYARRRGERFPLTLALGPGQALRSTLRRVNARAWDVSLQVDA